MSRVDRAARKDADPASGPRAHWWRGGAWLAGERATEAPRGGRAVSSYPCGHRRGRSLSPSQRLDRDAGELFERREPGGDLREAVVPQRPHALFDRGAFEFFPARLGRGQALHRLAHHEQLIDADPALVARLAAAGAALLAVEDDAVGGRGAPGGDARLDPLFSRRRVHLAAVAAEFSRQPLGEHRRDRRARQERLDTHLVQARERTGRVVRMQRREYEVARQRGLDRDLGGLAVANLADHHDVGVGAEDRAQRGREGQARALVDLHLVDAAEPELDRILDRDDVDLRPVDLGQRRVKRRRLTRAGRPRHEDRAGRAADHRLHLRAHVVREAELRQRRRLLRLVEQTHHDLFALDRRQRRHADVEHPAGGGGVERDAAVLRLAALGDVELREHLQARRDAGRHPPRDALHLVQHAVDAQPHGQRILLGLEVDVAGPVLGGLEDDRVDQPDERDVGDAVLDLEVVGIALRLGLGEAVFDLDCRTRAERLGGTGESPDLVLDVVAGRDGDLELVARGQTQLVDRLDVAGVGDRNLNRRAVERVRDGHDPLQYVYRDLLGGLLGDARQRQVDERQLEAAGERTRQAFGRRDAFVDDRLRERAALFDASADGGEAVRCDEPGRLDQVGDELGDLVHRVRFGQRRASAWNDGFVASGASGEPQLVGPLEIHGIPRMRYRQNPAES